MEAIKIKGPGIPSTQILDKLYLNYVLWRREDRNRGREPSVILMHPETWYEACKELTSLTTECGFDLRQANPKFRGIDIFRTQDINKNEIKVL